MRFRTVLGVLVVAAAVVAAVGPGPALGQPVPGASDTQGTPVSDGTNTTIAIRPRPNGDARVRVSATFTLESRNDTAAFRALSRDFEEGRQGFSVGTFRRAANESSDVTGRPMNVTNVTRNTTIEGENSTRPNTGRLVLGFTWTNFARTSGEHLFVGDAFNTTHGTWLPGLTASQTLKIESPRRYAITRSPVGISNGTARWEGPAEFAAGQPSLAFERRDSAGQTNPDDGGGPLASMPLFALVAGVALLGVAVGAYALARRGGAKTDEVADERTTDTEAATDADETAEHAAEPLADAELLSDEERVERLLKRNGGRMKQASIVTETGWSNAKVSQLLSTMDEAGQVEKLRIGRENLISLPEDGEDDGR